MHMKQETLKRGVHTEMPRSQKLLHRAKILNESGKQLLHTVRGMAHTQR